MTSGNIFPRRLTKIDELTRPDHWYLDENDPCFFLGEYTARMGFVYSETNNLILNFKKSMDRREFCRNGSTRSVRFHKSLQRSAKRWIRGRLMG